MRKQSHHVVLRLCGNMKMTEIFIHCNFQYSKKLLKYDNDELFASRFAHFKYLN